MLPRIVLSELFTHTNIKICKSIAATEVAAAAMVISLQPFASFFHAVLPLVFTEFLHLGQLFDLQNLYNH